MENLSLFLEEDVIDATKVAEDYSKVMTADFVMSVSRKVEDKIANTGRFHVIKNRFGPDGLSNLFKYFSLKAVKFQSGFIYQYAFVMLIGFSLILTIIIIK